MRLAIFTFVEPKYLAEQYSISKLALSLAQLSPSLLILKNCETHNRGEWFLLFSTYCDIKYLLRPVAICHHLSLFNTIYHHPSLSVTNCQYLSLSTKVTIKQATDGVAVKKTFPKAIENQDLNDHQ